MLPRAVLARSSAWKPFFIAQIHHGWISRSECRGWRFKAMPLNVFIVAILIHPCRGPGQCNCTVTGDTVPRGSFRSTAPWGPAGCATGSWRKIPCHVLLWKGESQNKIFAEHRALCLATAIHISTACDRFFCCVALLRSSGRRIDGGLASHTWARAKHLNPCLQLGLTVHMCLCLALLHPRNGLDEYF